MPDVPTLVQLAELFGVTVHELVIDPNELPESTGAVEKAMEKVVEKTLKRKADKRIILGLASLLVWFVALLLFVVISSLAVPRSWVAFIYAVPVNAVVLLSLRSAWHDFRWNQFLVSTIMWGGILSIYVTLLVFFSWNIWKLFLLGIPGQAAILLWFRMFRNPAKEEKNG